MERLAKRADNNKPVWCLYDCTENCDRCEHLTKMVMKLADYEDAEENGLLYMKVYVLEDFCHKPRDCEGDCEFCSSNEPCIDSEYIPYSEFDKTKHFKTREEAEQALKQMGD